jgi:Kef-type K+ transport system membrane component KefB
MLCESARSAGIDGGFDAIDPGGGLAAAAIAAPLGRALRMGAVLGYLAAGVIIGPYILGPLYS